MVDSRMSNPPENEAIISKAADVCTDRGTLKNSITVPNLSRDHSNLLGWGAKSSSTILK